MQRIDAALHFALERAGKSIAARMAMMAMTTSNSINVKPSLRAAVLGMSEQCSLVFMVS